MRVLARFVIAVALVVLLALAGLYLARKPIVEAATERIMAGLGLENPHVAAAEVSLSRFAFSSVAAGADKAAPDLSLAGVDIEYSWSDLLFRSRVKTLAISDGAARIVVTDKGAVSVAGWSPDPDAKPAPPPLKTLAIETLTARIDTPKGQVSGVVSGEFDYSAGGDFNVDFAAETAGFNAMKVADASGRIALTLDADGAIRAKGAIKGDAQTPIGDAAGVDVDLDATLASWRGFFGDAPRGLTGEAMVAVNSSMIDAASLAPLGAGGPTIKALAVTGAFTVVFSGDGYAVTLRDGPFSLVADRGDSLQIDAGDGPVLEKKGETLRLKLAATLDGLVAKGRASLQAASAEPGRWRFDADASLPAQKILGFSITGFDGAFRGDVIEQRVTGAAEIATEILAGGIGRMTIRDMPVKGVLDFDFNAATKSLVVHPAAGTCLEIDRAGFEMTPQDMDARVNLATLCPTAAPMISVKMNERTLAHVEGALAARSARYRIGRTEFDGAPPLIDFTLDYEPAAQKSVLAGKVAGGRVVLSKTFVLADVVGDFDATLTGETMAAHAALQKMTIAQTRDDEFVAPVAVSGGATLAGEVAQFDFKVKTPAGAPLGTGEGRHDVKTGKGEALFDSGLLRFSPTLQPDRLIPPLRGVISRTNGATEGRARFEWTPAGVSSSATVNLDDVSFVGPGVAVTRTEGVTGKLVFSSLSPVATGGEQAISIRKIDLDALKLENGEIRFILPGDDTLNIIEAEFPWFSGTIGAYDSVMSIAGGSKTTLQIDNVDLAELLGYINVDGLSGIGTIEGVLPIKFEGGKARIVNGILSSKGDGVIRYQGKATSAAAQSSEQSNLAFEVLRELRFETLAATIDGPLDGTLDFNILFEGRSDIPVRTGKTSQRVDSPVKYRVTIKAPLLSLIEQAALSANVKLQIERAQKEQEAAAKDPQ